MKTAREIRKERFMSRKFVCQKLGIKPNSLSKKESGLRKFTLQEALLLSNLYQVAPTDVADFTVGL